MMLIATPHAEYGTSEQVEARYVHHTMVMSVPLIVTSTGRDQMVTGVIQ